MPFSWQTATLSLPLPARPLVMGIVNLTPDSFSDGGRYSSLPFAVTRALEMEAAGADLLDFGAESTRPGAAPVPAEEEGRRLFPVLEALRGKLKIPLSVDTTKAAIAEGAWERGAAIVNDISGGRFDPELQPVVARRGLGYVLTHSRGTPETMQTLTGYAGGDVAGEVARDLAAAAAAAEGLGIARERIVLDPGFGFAKTTEENLALLARLRTVAALPYPLLIGLSRKSFLKRVAGEAALEVSTRVAETFAATQGARIWRTHDVASARAASQLLEGLGVPPDSRS
ncbi:dihydropteroate synthase [Verrucomicrobium sp. GAS474]|uniref:dihydropteroate synthase n=1 Tax=Verrucomicrobium sp. GAS474 TaxID=1882831 RepID=UPI00087DEA5C|nr:dihydropteroate synthase [Verrucomicrobium sp. GAS474]SDU01377.1 dihydropteroate synthase [Verrucomicrobium sp. GAS474]